LRSSASAYFSRAFASTPTTFTVSFWLKRGTLGTAQRIFGVRTSGSIANSISFTSGDILETYSFQQGLTLNTTAVYRDPSSWYHFVISTTTGNTTVYCNNVQVATSATAFRLFNSAAAGNSIGRDGDNPGAYFDGYLTEINFIDGQALTPSSFGAYNSYGVWSPAKYTGSYGTNGFYLSFQDNSALTTTANVGIGKDSSGNGNYWTSNNISLTAGATYDSMLDVPTNSSATNANYAVLNAVETNYGTLSNANLSASLTVTGSTGRQARGTFLFPSSGKFYFEVNPSALGVVGQIGVAKFSSATNGGNGISPVFSAGDVYLYLSNGQKQDGVTASAYGASFTTSNVIGVAVDVDNGTLVFYKDNVSQGTAYSSLTLSNYYPVVHAAGAVGTASYNINFGQRPFTYTPPTGFVSLNTYNLPDSIVPVGAQYMAATTYTGTGAARSIANTVNGASFQPDFVWIKDRSVLSAHALTNAVTGITKYLESNTTAAETTDTTSVTALSSTGFNLGVGTATYYTNRNGESFVAWQWKASNASAVTNTSGTGTSSVSANQTAGFSVVTMTGIPTSAGTNTYGHGLGAAPRLIIFKNINIVDSWYVYHASLGNAAYVRLDLSAAQITSAAIWGNTSPTSSVFTLRNNALNTTTGQIILAYCFAEVPGYSKISSYTANGSADGPFVYCGFRPRFILVKDASSGGGNWDILDTSRSPYNLSTARLMANQNAAEDTGLSVDVLSNGFKVRIASSDWGVTNGNTVIFAAFAENPFKNALAR
jgi:hypothetical protein